MVELNNIHGLEYNKNIKNTKEKFSNLSVSDSVYNSSTNNPNYNILYNQETENDAIKNIDDSEITKLTNLKTEYDRALSVYSNELNILNTMINNYSSASNTRYKNRNVKLSDGTLGYITNNGVWKSYSSDNLYNKISNKRSCPSTSINNLKTLNGTIDTDYNIINVDNKNKFIIGSPMTENQGCGLSGTNIYVTNTQAPINKQTYSGCYNLNESNGLIYQSDMGDNATLNSCRIRAFDTNSEVFALSSSNGLPNSGKCYVGKNLENVINGGQAIYTRVIWTQSAQPLNGARSARLNYAGQLEILDSEKNVLWISNLPQDNCDPNNGGRISVKNASWGSNCNGRKSNSRSVPWNVPVDNLLSYAKSVADGKDLLDFTLNHNIINPETNNKIGDVAQGCKKNFISYYICGTQGGKLLKNANQSGEANGKLITYDCQEHTQRCENFKLIVNDNLNVVINDGKTNSNIWETYTTNVSKNAISTNEYNGPSSRYGREYIQPGESLVDGEYIGSPNGFCYLVFINNVGLELRINLSGCSKGNDGNFYGGNLTDDIKGINFTVYNKYFNDNLSFFDTAKIINGGITKDLSDISTSTNNLYSSSNLKFSIVFTGVLFVRENQSGNWTFKLTSDDASYMWIGKDALKNNSTISNAFISNGNTHKSITKVNTIDLDGGAYYPIKIIYGNNTGLGNFNLKFSAAGVSERSNLNDYIYAYTPNDGLATYSIELDGDNINNLGNVGYVTPDGKLKRIPERLITLSNNNYNNNYIEIGNYSNNNNLDNIGIINSSNVDTCKNECNKNEKCHGFVYKDNKCYLKNENIYPKTIRVYDENARLFKRNIDILTHSSCNKNVVPIDNKRWNDFPLDESGSPIDENTECGMGIYLKDQKNKVLDSSNKLKDISSKIIERINSLNKNDQNIIDKLGISKKKMINTLDNININENKYNKKDKLLINESGMKNSSYNELLSNNYNYLIWSILAVSIGIGSIYYAKKKINK